MGDSFIEMAKLIDDINSMIYYFIGMLIVLFSWFSLVGVPFVTFFNVLKTEKEEISRGVEEDTAYLYIKTTFITLIISFIVSIIYFGLFINVLQVTPTAGELVNKVLFLQ